MIITWRETLSYLRRLGARDGMSIAVIGSGGNALSFMTLAAIIGAGPRVMIGAAGRSEIAVKAGAEACFNYRDDDIAVSQALNVCSDGFDIVIDAVGKVAAADLGLALIKPGGTFGSYGVDEIDKYRIDPDRARGTFTVSNEGYDEAETHEEVVALIEGGKLDASLWLDPDNAYNLDDITAAFDAVRRRQHVKALVSLKDSS